MLCKNIILSCVAVFATVSSAAPSPLMKRAISVSTDTGAVDITPAVSTGLVTIAADDATKADAVGAVVAAIGKIVELIQGLIDGDITRRQRFTQETVAAVATQFPGRNVVMSNVGYQLSGTPEVLSSTSYKAKVGSDVSYDVLVFGAGLTFELRGNGGFENWAFVSSTCTRNGKTLTC